MIRIVTRRYTVEADGNFTKDICCTKLKRENVKYIMTLSSLFKFSATAAKRHSSVAHRCPVS